MRIAPKMTWGLGPLPTGVDAFQVEVGGGAGAGTSVASVSAVSGVPSAAPVAAGAAAVADDTGGVHGSSGTMAHMTRYTITNAPPVKIASRSHSTRLIDGSMSK
jgi:hypothetical protein